MSIESFQHKGLRRLFEDEDTRGIPAALAQKLKRLLGAMDTAEDVDELGLYPGWRLHPLKGDLKGFWSLTVSGNWRIIFRMTRDKIEDVDLIDYH